MHLEQKTSFTVKLYVVMSEIFFLPSLILYLDNSDQTFMIPIDQETVCDVKDVDVE